ncbi:MAG: NHL repeat-containing protein [Phycisphaerales bacterium]|nr:NHL repeat-containing protein [Phycisphaerales bacterium]
MRNYLFISCILIFLLTTSCNHNNDNNTGFSKHGIIIAGGNGRGHKLNQLETPRGVCFDSKENLYVCDWGNHRVLKFPANSHKETMGVVVVGAKGEGYDDDRLSFPTGIAMDTFDNLYVVDYGNNRIQKFKKIDTGIYDSHGITVAGGNGSGSGLNQFYKPWKIAFDKDQNIYVTDWGNDRVMKFPPNSTKSTIGVVVAGGLGEGPELYQLHDPRGIFIDSAGNIFVCDINNNRIMKFPPNSVSGTPGVVVAGDTYELGHEPNHLWHPTSVYLDRQGHIFVTDAWNNRVQEFPAWEQMDTKGITVAGDPLGEAGNSLEKLNNPNSLIINHEGDLIFGDANNHRIMKFKHNK